jgi:pimeloyl-ACP methyl ester carboxylesterase
MSGNGPLTRIAWAVFLFARHFVRKELRYEGIGVSGGGNVLLHMATKQPERVKAMVLVSATSYFPA